MLLAFFSVFSPVCLRKNLGDVRDGLDYVTLRSVAVHANSLVRPCKSILLSDIFVCLVLCSLGFVWRFSRGIGVVASLWVRRSIHFWSFFFRHPAQSVIDMVLRIPSSWIYSYVNPILIALFRPARQGKSFEYPLYAVSAVKGPLCQWWQNQEGWLEKIDVVSLYIVRKEIPSVRRAFHYCTIDIVDDAGPAVGSGVAWCSTFAVRLDNLQTVTKRIDEGYVVAI